jgi:hypothetical protein
MNLLTIPALHVGNGTHIGGLSVEHGRWHGATR